MQQLVYKVCARADWSAAVASGAYDGSVDDRRDGFIHLSTAEQLAGTLAKHFKGQADLVLATFVADDLGASLRWEAARGGQLFPHVYGPLPTVLARAVVPLPVGADGLHRLPKDLT